MDTINDTRRLDQKIWINSYIDNFGTLNKGVLISALFFHFFMVLNFLLLTNAILEVGFDYFKIMDKIQYYNVQILKYIFYNMVWGLNALNYLNELNILFNQDIFNINLNYQHYPLNLTIWGYIFIGISILSSLMINSLYIYQSYAQKMIRPAEIVSLYVPILFLKSFNTRDKTNQVKVKLIEKLRDRPIRKEHLEKLAQKLFKKFDTNIHEVETKEQSILNIYHYKVIYLNSKSKNKSKKDKTNESNKTQTIQEHHQDKQSQTEIPDEFI
jgi:hypothetical protein